MKIIKKLIVIGILLAIITFIFFPKRLFSKEDFVQFETIEYEGKYIYVNDGETISNIDFEKILDALLECRRQPRIDRRINTIDNMYTISLTTKKEYICIVLSETENYMYTNDNFSHQRLTNTEKLREVLSEYK